MTRVARIRCGGGRGGAGRGAEYGGAGRGAGHGGAGHDRAGRGAAGRAGSGAERGSVTLFAVFFTLVALALASLLVDVGNAVNAQERAADLAEQAARAAANAIDVADLRSGTVTIDQTRACADASNLIRAYAAAGRVDAAMTGPCTYPSPRQVTVSVSVTTTPLISTFFGRFSMKAHETACAEFGITHGVGC
jgi:type II secretory pathway pseudopilin PulG